jgi:uncharacterized LabA/DUF88 family protein
MGTYTSVMAAERMMIFIDARNIKSSQEKFNGRNGNFIFGYKETIEFFSNNYQVIRGYFYDGSPHPNDLTSGRRAFFDNLRRIGITLRLKELNPNHPTQKGVDIYLTADMISLAYEDAYDIAVILSGDGDYTALVELVKSKGKKVWIVSFKDSLSQSLRDCADKVLVIDKMLTIFNRRKENHK